MSAATNAFETDLLELIFENTNIANIGDTTGLRGSTTAGNFYLSLSTAAVTDTAVQNTSEAAYTGYGRQTVARSTTGWTVSGDSCTNDSLIQFGEATGGTPETMNSVIIGTDSTGAGYALCYGTVSLVVNNGVNPQFAASALTITMA